MKIPDKIKVGGHEYKVIKGHSFKERADCDGQTDHGDCEIRLSGMMDNRTTCLSRQGATFCHELIHAIDHTFNGRKLDEETVDRLGEGLYQVLKDNEIQL